MSNVIRLRGRPSHACAPSASAEPGPVDRETIIRITEMQLAAKSGLQESLSLFDAAFTKIRQLNAMIVDPNVRTAVEGEIAALEKALSSARVRALEI